MTTNQELERPTTQQTKYLGYLLVRAHQKGVPHLPITALSRSQVSEWIDYLQTVVGIEKAEERKSSSSSFSRDPLTFLPVRPGTDGYRPALRESAALSAIAPKHDHSIEPWSTEDGWEVLECTTCGAQW